MTDEQVTTGGAVDLQWTIDKWSDEGLKYVAFDVATRYLVDKSAGKATPLTQYIQEKLIEMRNYKDTTIATQAAQIKRLTAEKREAITLLQSLGMPIEDITVKTMTREEYEDAANE